MKKVFYIFLCLCLMLSSIAEMAFADGDSVPWEYLLVNDTHLLAPEYAPEEIGYIDSGLGDTEIQTNEAYNMRYCGVDLRIAHPLLDMLLGCRNAGLPVFLSSGYRSYAELELTFQRLMANGGRNEESVKEVMAYPGANEHQTGLCCDITDYYRERKDLSFEETETFKWLQTHCAEYGFVLRYPKYKEDITGRAYEPWHFRYVGKDAAEYMRENNLCLEEFVELYTNGEVSLIADAGAVQKAYEDEDGDGLILVPVGIGVKIDPATGSVDMSGSYRGRMLIVLEPSRVVLGIDTENPEQAALTLGEYAARYDAAAAISGGKADENQQAATAFVSAGELYNAEKSVEGFVGFDADNVLQVGFAEASELAERNIRDGVACGPVLVVNGEMVDDPSLESGVNPRTAIGQRADGAVLLLSVDGRVVESLGATYKDLAKEMLSFGAVTACVLSSGSVAQMWVDGEYVSILTSANGEPRPVPAAFVVLKTE